jgi:hypothetical protein
MPETRRLGGHLRCSGRAALAQQHAHSARRRPASCRARRGWLRLALQTPAPAARSLLRDNQSQLGTPALCAVRRKASECRVHREKAECRVHREKAALQVQPIDNPTARSRGVRIRGPAHHAVARSELGHARTARGGGGRERDGRRGSAGVLGGAQKCTSCGARAHAACEPRSARPRTGASSIGHRGTTGHPHPDKGYRQK